MKVSSVIGNFLASKAVSARLRERATAAQAELLEDDGGGAEPGERGLDHVQPGEGRQQIPIRIHIIAQYESQQDDASCEGENGFVDIHGMLLLKGCGLTNVSGQPRSRRRCCAHPSRRRGGRSPGRRASATGWGY